MISKRLWTYCIAAVLIVTAVFSSVSQLCAQVGTATISGAVTDPSGAIVPKVEIVIESTERKFTRQVTTDSLGEYVFTALPPGRYQLTATAPGFREEKFSDVLLSSGQASTLNVKINVLAAAEQVTVSEAPPLLQTTNATVGNVVAAKQMSELPLLGRNYTKAMLIVPGVSAIDAPDTYNRSVEKLTISPSFYGQRQRDNTFMLDGMSNKDPLFQDPNMVPPPESIAEMKIESGMSSGAYGRSSGANINVVTKSGSNQLHGDLWEFLKNKDLNSRSFFTPKLGPYTYNQFGAGVGGPVVIPKLFSKDRAWYVYGYYEGIRLRSSSNATALVPTAAELNGDFTGDPVIYNPYTTTTANGVTSAPAVSEQRHSIEPVEPIGPDHYQNSAAAAELSGRHPSRSQLAESRGSVQHEFRSIQRARGSSVRIEE